MKRRLKLLKSREIKEIVEEIKMLLHAHRDALRNQGHDTAIMTFDCRDGYYGEAFGVMRTLVILGYGYFGSSNLDAVSENRSNFPYHNLKWWFGELEKEILQEEGFGGDNICLRCLTKYGSCS